jgi:hypothetical protein
LKLIVRKASAKPTSVKEVSAAPQSDNDKVTTTLRAPAVVKKAVTSEPSTLTQAPKSLKRPLSSDAGSPKRTKIKAPPSSGNANPVCREAHSKYPKQLCVHFLEREYCLPVRCIGGHTVPNALNLEYCHANLTNSCNNNACRKKHWTGHTLNMFYKFKVENLIKDCDICSKPDSAQTTPSFCLNGHYCQRKNVSADLCQRAFVGGRHCDGRCDQAHQLAPFVKMDFCRTHLKTPGKCNPNGHHPRHMNFKSLQEHYRVELIKAAEHCPDCVAFEKCPLEKFLDPLCYKEFSSLSCDKDNCVFAHEVAPFINLNFCRLNLQNLCQAAKCAYRHVSFPKLQSVHFDLVNGAVERCSYCPEKPAEVKTQPLVEVKTEQVCDHFPAAKNICFATFSGNGKGCRFGANCFNAHAIPDWMTDRVGFCKFHIYNACKNGPRCLFPHLSTKELNACYREELAAMRNSCVECSRRKRNKNECSNMYCDIVLLESVTVQADETNRPTTTVCAIVGEGDFSGRKIEIEQADTASILGEKWYCKYNLNALVGKGNVVTLELRSGASKATRYHLPRGTLVARTLL